MVYLEVGLSLVYVVNEDVNIGVCKGTETSANELNNLVVLLVDLFDLAVNKYEFGYLFVNNITIRADLKDNVAGSVINQVYLGHPVFFNRQYFLYKFRLITEPLILLL